LSCLQYKLDLAKKRKKKKKKKRNKETKPTKTKSKQKKSRKRGKKRRVEQKKCYWFYIKLLDRTLTFHCVHFCKLYSKKKKEKRKKGKKNTLYVEN